MNSFNNMNRIPKMPIRHSESYSGNKMNVNVNNINENINNKVNNTKNYNSVYKGMDGREYYNEKELDIANRMFLEEQMKRNNTN